MTIEQEGWHPEDIKAAIRKRGITLVKLALDNGLSESGCRKALHIPCPRADALISNFLGVPRHVLWPKRYDAKGRKLYLSDRRKNTRPRPPRNSSKNAEN